MFDRLRRCVEVMRDRDAQVVRLAELGRGIDVGRPRIPGRRTSAAHVSPSITPAARKLPCLHNPRFHLGRRFCRPAGPVA